ncbi:hypothetical protein SCLCIDRAFT_923060 [Scleroderma citrinum Foug A]|uniref:Uncharacterized protein n=1 Tax=Scleroderma citrinum Foug A TaxID=1036808 RepID=A0A0C3A7M6_9AGAM|nr:hypothetical protein SCLCIDRAFT_923060 [Scleroderma citrinum Foug A]
MGHRGCRLGNVLWSIPLLSTPPVQAYVRHYLDRTVPWMRGIILRLVLFAISDYGMSRQEPPECKCGKLGIMLSPGTHPACWAFYSPLN